MFAAQEANIPWNLATTQQILSQAQHTMPHLAMATASSSEDATNWYKPGGTFPSLESMDQLHQSKRHGQPTG